MSTIRFLLFCTLTSLALTCRADFTEYDIEIIIFEDVSGNYLNSEKWPYNVITTSEEEPVNNSQNVVINIGSSKEHLLMRYVTAIKRSKKYNLLEYKTWRQAGLEADSAINIVIDSARTEEKQSNNVSLLAPVTGEKPAEVKPTSSIKGNIKVVLGRYLHLYTDLIYKRAKPVFIPVIEANDTTTKKITEFRIKAHRKMRSKELHYIDHPLVGMLITAIPVETRKSEDELQTGSN